MLAQVKDLISQQMILQDNKVPVAQMNVPEKLVTPPGQLEQSSAAGDINPAAPISKRRKTTGNRRMQTIDNADNKLRTMKRVFGLGSKDTASSKSKNYTYRCIKPGCTFGGQHLDRHLLVHFGECEARQHMNIIKAQYKYIMEDKKVGRKKA